MRAIVIGATGLVGNLILKELLNDNDFTEVRIFIRISTGISNPKLREFINPMKDIEALGPEIVGDVLFNAMGTTIKQAGTQAEQQRIDRDLPVLFAKFASQNGVGIMVNVSSVGANMKSGFYLKTKAEMENGTMEFFHRMAFHFRPGFLIGKRKDYRPVEKVASVIMKVADHLLIGPFRKYRSMPADLLAKAIVNLSKNPKGKMNVLYYPEIMQCIGK
jgi:uncharacterized protein YbjT (DUF2867 family)